MLRRNVARDAARVCRRGGRARIRRRVVADCVAGASVDAEDGARRSDRPIVLSPPSPAPPSSTAPSGSGTDVLPPKSPGSGAVSPGAASSAPAVAPRPVTPTPLYRQRRLPRGGASRHRAPVPPPRAEPRVTAPAPAPAPPPRAEPRVTAPAPVSPPALPSLGSPAASASRPVATAPCRAWSPRQCPHQCRRHARSPASPRRLAPPRTSAEHQRPRRRSWRLRRLCPRPRRTQPPADHFSLALHYQRINDFDNALAHYRALLEQNDASAEVHNNLGDAPSGSRRIRRCGQAVPAGDRDQSSVRQSAQQPRRGADAFQPAGRGRRGNSSASRWRRTRATSSRLSTPLRSSGKPQGALLTRADLLRRAVAIDPRNAGSHYNLSRRRDESGDALTAVEHYRAFLRFGAVAHGTSHRRCARRGTRRLSGHPMIM